MNVNIIFYVPEQIPYLGKIFIWRLDQNALSQSDCSIFKLITSPKQIDETASFLYVDTKSLKMKSWLKVFGWAWSKVGLANLVLGL